tara:strand:- start:431 stop:1129 length:699 start_codon:yes stop_codon:yes gene_type:complete
MPISHAENIIFIHIPKTGGGSIEKSLGIFGEDNNGSLNPNLNILYGKKNNKLLQHLTISEIKGIKNKEYKTYKKITFVRNPFDKLLSEYFWRIQRYGKNKIDFKYFLMEEAIPRKNKINTYVKNFYKDEKIISSMDIHYMEQYKFLINNNNLDVDSIGKFEDFESDFKKLFNKKLLNYKINKSKVDYFYYLSKKFLPKFIKKRLYRKFYDNDSRKLVEEEYKKDLDLFNYNF